MAPRRRFPVSLRRGIGLALLLAYLIGWGATQLLGVTSVRRRDWEPHGTARARIGYRRLLRAYSPAPLVVVVESVRIDIPTPYFRRMVYVWTPHGWENLDHESSKGFLPDIREVPR